MYPNGPKFPVRDRFRAIENTVYTCRKTITPMECPHKTWKLDVFVSVCKTEFWD